MARKIIITKDVKPGPGIIMRRVTIPDKGAPGLTPKSKRFFKPKEGALGGWSKDLSDNSRHMILVGLVRKDGLNTVKKRLIALENVTTDRKTAMLARADFNYLKGSFG